jgi:hypothetical protein
MQANCVQIALQDLVDPLRFAETNDRRLAGAVRRLARAGRYAAPLPVITM